MPIEFRCNGCSKKLRVDESAAGKQARCPTCGAVNRIPLPGEESPAVQPRHGAGPVEQTQLEPTPSSDPLPSNLQPSDSLSTDALASDSLPSLAPLNLPPQSPSAQAPGRPPAPLPAAATGRPIGQAAGAALPASPFASSAAPKGAAGNPFAQNPGAAAPVNPYQAPSSAGYAPMARPLGYRQLAGRGKRFLGAILDALFHILGVLPGAALFGVGVGMDEEILAMIGLLVMFGGVLGVAIYNWVLISTRGQSIAKRMLGMRIIREDTGELPGFLNGVVLRIWVPALINQACNLFGIIDALWIFGEESRCLHDLIASTIVVDVIE